MLPVDGDRPIFHATDIKFDSCSGKNILCFSTSVDLRRNFNATFSKLSFIKGFMTVRTIPVRLKFRNIYF